MTRPNFFIVGAPKCGTSSMYYYLKQHPDIYMPRYRKEPHYFTTDFPSIRFDGGLDEYLSLFDGADGEKLIGEATTWYLYSREAAGEIKAFAPESRIIIMLRDPVDMLYSLHGQWLFSANEDIRDFAEALEAEEERKRGERMPRYCYFPEGLFYREVVRYTEQVKRYFDTFGRDKVHVIIFDDLRKDAAGVYRDTLSFLGVDDSFSADLAVKNEKRRARAGAVSHILRNPPALLAAPIRKVLAKETRMAVRKRIKRLNSVPSTRGPMDPELRRRLTEEFSGEVESLGELLGRDLSPWTLLST